MPTPGNVNVVVDVDSVPETEAVAIKVTIAQSVRFLAYAMTAVAKPLLFVVATLLTLAMLPGVSNPSPLVSSPGSRIPLKLVSSVLQDAVTIEIQPAKVTLVPHANGFPTDAGTVGGLVLAQKTRMPLKKANAAAPVSCRGRTVNWTVALGTGLPAASVTSATKDFWYVKPTDATLLSVPRRTNSGRPPTTRLTVLVGCGAASTVTTPPTVMLTTVALTVTGDVDVGGPQHVVEPAM